MTHVTALMKGLGIELCLHGYRIWKWRSSCQGRATVWIWGQEHEVHAVATSTSGHHHDELSPLMVVGRQFFVDCGLPW